MKFVEKGATWAEPNDAPFQFYNAFTHEILIFFVRFAHCWKFSYFWSCLGLKVIIKC